MNLSISWDVKKKKKVGTPWDCQHGFLPRWFRNVQLCNYSLSYTYEVCAILYICYISQFLNLFIFSLPSGTCTKVKHPSSFFCFLSNYRIVKLWKLISCLTGSVYLSKRSRKQTRGILIDCFHVQPTLIVLLRDWILLTKISYCLEIISQDREYWVKVFFGMSCSKEFMVAELFSGNLSTSTVWNLHFPKAAHFIS